MTIMTYTFWGALWAYALTSILFLILFAFRKRIGITWAWRAMLLSFLILTAYLVLRWILVGHPPIMYQFEDSLLGAWMVNVIALIFILRYPSFRSVGMFIAPFTLILLGYGMTGGMELLPLAPPFKSNWLWIHISFAWVAYGSFIIAAIMSVLYLLKDSKEMKGGGVSSSYDWLPETSKMNDFILMFIILGFTTQIVQVAAGSLWARILWGRYWNWDPIETWSLIVWLAYGSIIHLRLSLGWKGRRLAWLTIGALVFEIICLGGIGFAPAPHTSLLWS